MGEDALAALQEALSEAIRAAVTALLALLLVLATILVRAFQAIFILARPAALAGTVVAAGYMSVTLFVTILARYGNDLPAAMLALSAVVITPATFLVLKADSGTWAVMLAVAVIEFLAHLGIERAPPLVLAALPAVGLTATILYHLKHTNQDPDEQGPETQGENEHGRQQIGSRSVNLADDHCTGDLQHNLQL